MNPFSRDFNDIIELANKNRWLEESLEFTERRFGVLNRFFKEIQ